MRKRGGLQSYELHDNKRNHHTGTSKHYSKGWQNKLEEFASSDISEWLKTTTIRQYMSIQNTKKTKFGV